MHCGKPGVLPMRKIRFILFIFLAVLASCTPRQIHPPPPLPPPPKPARICLVLGAGAAKGFAHIGVLKVFQAQQVPIHTIVGTSAGSLVGCLFAYGYSAFRLQEMALSLEKGDLLDFTIPDKGFIRGEKLAHFVNKMTGHTPLEEMKIPFYAVATDIQSGQEVVFGRGNAGTAVRASCSVPGIFQPVRIGDRLYVDGGVVSPVAVDAARRQGADVIIAVDISSPVESAKSDGILETLLQSIDIMYSRLASNQCERADVVIRPRVGHIASSDFSRRHEAILEGEKAATAALPGIRELLEKLKREGRIP